jgi:hypothetical protein
LGVAQIDLDATEQCLDMQVAGTIQAPPGRVPPKIATASQVGPNPGRGM